MMRALTLSAAVCGSLWLNAALADVASGPESGAALSPLKVQAVTGSIENKEVDYTAERGEKPTVYVFIPREKWDRPVARFLRQLDEEAGKAGHGAALVVVFLSDAPEQTADYLPRAQMAIKFQQTALAVFPSTTNLPDGWNLSTEADVTVVVARAGKAVESWGFVSVNETLVPTVSKSLQKAVETSGE